MPWPSLLEDEQVGEDNGESGIVRDASSFADVDPHERPLPGGPNVAPLGQNTCKTVMTVNVPCRFMGRAQGEDLSPQEMHEMT